jgi:hypothetical protein
MLFDTRHVSFLQGDAGAQGAAGDKGEQGERVRNDEKKVIKNIVWK